MSRYSELIRRLQAADSIVRYAGPQPESRLIELETKWDLRLPESYREFVLHHGAGGIPGGEIIGIDDDYMDSEFGTMAPTLYYKRDFGLPDGLFVIQTDPDGEAIVCLDLRKRIGGESPVVAYSLATRRIDGVLAGSFGEYMQKYLEGAIGD